MTWFLILLAVHGVFSMFNYVNSYLDWYRISIKNKTIKHWLNLLTYAVVVALVNYWLWRHYHMSGWLNALISVSAFFCRQITFDIPLNIRRKLDPFYQSKEHKAVMDLIEYRLFGGISGKALALIYASLWAITFIIQLFL